MKSKVLNFGKCSKIQVKGAKLESPSRCQETERHTYTFTHTQALFANTCNCYVLFLQLFFNYVWWYRKNIVPLHRQK